MAQQPDRDFHDHVPRDPQAAELQPEQEFRAILGFVDLTEVSGREYRPIEPAEEAQLQALVAGRLGVKERERLMSFVAENGLALRRLAELLQARERSINSG
ncbi:MAG: hypothetical protein JO069_18580 [Verrucomicrobia bacterium]|nr:hypothetical protein [Verrucomicrobiota bacterium]